MHSFPVIVCCLVWDTLIQLVTYTVVVVLREDVTVFVSIKLVSVSVDRILSLAASIVSVVGKWFNPVSDAFGELPINLESLSVNNECKDSNTTIYSR